MYPITQLCEVADADGTTRYDVYGMDGTDESPLIAQARRDPGTGEWVATYIREQREARGRDQYAAIHAAIHGGAR